jgi:hypothetical protein
MKRIISALALAGVVLAVAAFAAPTAPVAAAGKSCITIIPITPSDSLASASANTSGNDVYFFVKKISGASSTEVTVTRNVTGNLSNVVFGGGPNPFDLDIVNQSLDVNYFYDTGAAGTGTIQVIATGTPNCGADTLTYVVTIS